MALLEFGFDPPSFGNTGRIPKGQPGAGRFTSGYAAAAEGDAVMREIQDDFYALAAEVQDEVANYTEENKKREGGTGRLDRAIRDPRNVVIYSNGFEVGIPDWLDRSPAAIYWRQIEEGTDVHIGQVIYGSFADSGGWAPPKKEFIGVGTSHFQPGKMKDGSEWLSGKGEIHEGIEAREAYTYAWDELNVPERALEIVEAALSSLY